MGSSPAYGATQKLLTVRDFWPRKSLQSNISKKINLRYTFIPYCFIKY